MISWSQNVIHNNNFIFFTRSLGKCYKLRVLPLLSQSHQAMTRLLSNVIRVGLGEIQIQIFSTKRFFFTIKCVSKNVYLLLRLHTYKQFRRGLIHGVLQLPRYKEYPLHQFVASLIIYQLSMFLSTHCTW